MSKPLEPFPLLPENDEQPEPPVPAYQPVEQQQSSSKKAKLITMVITVAVLLAAGSGAAYWFFIRSRPTASQSTQTANNATTQQPAADNSTNTGTTQYVANGNDLNLSFVYPSNWTVSPASGSDTNDQPISVTSPLVSLSDASNQAITGQIIVRIRPAAAQLDELASGKATVAEDSVQIAYTKPTAAQHQYPYLTYVHLAGGNDSNNLFEEVIITGVTKFIRGQALSPESLGGIDPVISATFYQCHTQACTGSGATPLSVNDSIWQNTQAFNQVQALFASLQLH